MDGPKGVVDHLVARLTQALPGKLAELRTRYTLAVNDVPDPVGILGWEPETEGLDQLPAVYVIEQSTTLHSIDKDPGGGTVWQ
ncbi:MAG: hypothetical protein M3Y35_01910, partial [Actinomycetota bacterium]|nr:hypothetical protein [Actinomycetota bacterium]